MNKFNDKKIAVVDLCHTLVSVNTTHDFLFFILSEKPIVRAILIFLLRVKFLSVLGRILNKDVLGLILLRFLNGRSIASIDCLVDNYINIRLKFLINKAVLDRFEKFIIYKKCKPVIVSASFPPIVHRFGLYLGYDSIAGEIGLNTNGYFSGKLVKHIAGQKDMAVDGAILELAVSDNREDIELLRKATEKIVVLLRPADINYWAQCELRAAQFIFQA